MRHILARDTTANTVVILCDFEQSDFAVPIDVMPAPAKVAEFYGTRAEELARVVFAAVGPQPTEFDPTKPDKNPDVQSMTEYTAANFVNNGSHFIAAGGEVVPTLAERERAFKADERVIWGTTERAPEPARDMDVTGLVDAIAASPDDEPIPTLAGWPPPAESTAPTGSVIDEEEANNAEVDESA